MKHFLVRLVTSPWETMRLLGLPTDAVACVFNVDGVLVASAAIHAEAWKEIFDEFIARRGEHADVPFASFSVRVDYPRHIHGRTRAEAIHAFLASRGIALPDGSPDDSLDVETVNGSPRKNRALIRVSTNVGGRSRAAPVPNSHATLGYAAPSCQERTRIMPNAHIRSTGRRVRRRNAVRAEGSGESPHPTCCSPLAASFRRARARCGPETTLTVTAVALEG
jgi:hypothetical protein